MTLPTELVFGSVIWLPTLRGSPDVAWIGLDDCPLPLYAVLQDVGPGATFDFIWNAGDGITLSATMDSMSRFLDTICRLGVKPRYP